MRSPIVAGAVAEARRTGHEQVRWRALGRDRGQCWGRRLWCLSGPGHGPGQGDLRHELEGPGRAWRLLSGRGRRHLRQARARRDRPAGRPAGQPLAAAGRRQDRLQHGRQPVRPVQLHPGQRADGDDRGDLPEGAAGAAGAPGRWREGAGRPRRQDLLHLQRRAADLLAVAAAGLRLQGRPGEALHLQSGAVPGRHQLGAAGLRHLRAVRDPAAGRVRAGGPDDGGLRLRHLLDHDRDLAEAGRREPRPGAALRQRHDRGLVQLSLRRQQEGQRADQGRQPRDDRRADRLLDRRR